MSRLVLPRVRYIGTPTRADRAPEAAQAVDEYQDRVAKYIPSEVVGGYVSLDGILAPPPAAPPLPTASADLAAHADMTALTPLLNLPTGIFLFCLVLAPIYVWHVARRSGNTVWRAQAAISTFAFAVWAYAIKGSVFFSNPALDQWSIAKVGHSFYDPKYAAALLVLFSLAVAFYQPTKTVDLSKS